MKKRVKFEQLPIQGEFTCYGIRYRKTGETAAINLLTKIPCKWSKSAVVKVSEVRPDESP
jgi:hypothetical protein